MPYYYFVFHLSADPNNPFKKKPRLARANSLKKPDVLSLESGPISDRYMYTQYA